MTKRIEPRQTGPDRAGPGRTGAHRAGATGPGRAGGAHGWRRAAWPAAALALMLAGLAAGGCSTTDPTQDQMARTTLDTAPADLQLLCAGAVASQTGAPADRTLPLSSRRLDQRSFQVEVDAAGKRNICVVDVDGNVTSIQPA